MLFSFEMDRPGSPGRNPIQFLHAGNVPHEFATQRCNFRQFRMAYWNPLKR
jgi:hypothetical protein